MSSSIRSFAARELYIPDVSGVPRYEARPVTPDFSKPTCLLIHGYNVRPEDARDSFELLFRTVERFGELPPLLRFRSWLVYWRAYASLGLASGKAVVSPLTYAQQVPAACIAAQALRRYIDDHSKNTKPQITIIAHSLGCRLALELLESYAKSPGPHIPHFPAAIFMAAAVPTYFFEELVLLWRGALLPTKRVVLFSGKDWVLTRAFRLGQTLAGEGTLPHAVGATGRPPSGFWTGVLPTENSHSGYFGDKNAASEVLRCSAYAVPARDPKSLLRSRTTEPARMLSSREIRSRPLISDRHGAS